MSETTELLNEEKEVAFAEAKRTLEALLFASSEPLSLPLMKELLSPIHPFSEEDLIHLIGTLQEEYRLQERAFFIVEMVGGWALSTREQFHPFLDQLFRKRKGGRLSRAALEVLAIVAFKQPITRAQIEEIRGVDSSSLLQTLMERELIETAGKLETPGRPALLRTTTEFLHYFGLHSPEELFQSFPSFLDQTQ